MTTTTSGSHIIRFIVVSFAANPLAYQFQTPQSFHEMMLLFFPSRLPEVFNLVARFLYHFFLRLLKMGKPFLQVIYHKVPCLQLLSVHGVNLVEPFSELRELLVFGMKGPPVVSVDEADHPCVMKTDFILIVRPNENAISRINRRCCRLICCVWVSDFWHRLVLRRRFWRGSRAIK